MASIIFDGAAAIWSILIPEKPGEVLFFFAEMHSFHASLAISVAALAHDRKARQCGKDALLNYDSTKAAEEAAAAQV
jgi:hypothetical protein